jgi:hypothetical protein
MDLVWNVPANKRFEHGVDRGVLFPRASDGTYENGVAWEGLTNVTKTPEGAESTDLFANNAKYAEMQSAETFKGTIEAYTHPDEFYECDGSAALDAAGGVQLSMQARKGFGLAFRTMIGSDAGGDQAGYKLHLVYGCKASPSEQAYSTINDSPEAITFSWEFSSTPASAGENYSPTSVIVVDSLKATTAFMSWLEGQLYGDSPTNDPTLPLPTEIITQALALT